MAIGRIAGNMLMSELDRQGVDLQLTTDGSPLLFLDFSTFRAVINGDISAATKTFTVVGDAQLDDIVITGSNISSTLGISFTTPLLTLGDVGQVSIGGGSENFILTTNGAGVLSWQDIAVLSQMTNLTGMDVSLGTPPDGSLAENAAYRNWTTDTEVTTAIDDLNQVMLNVYSGTYVGAVDFTANIVAGPSPITVSFTPSIIGNPNNYYWEFGDGSTSTLCNPIHTYSNVDGGQFDVFFRAKNTDGTLSGNGVGDVASKLKPDYITLYTPTPVPLFSLNKASIDSGSAVILTNLSTYADSYVIHWGDGAITTISSNLVAGAPGQSPVSHTYTNTGSDTIYQIYIEARSETAGPTGVTISSAPTSVRVHSVIAPTFTATPTVGNNQHNVEPTGLAVTFTNTTSMIPGLTSSFASNHYEWDWGDGTTTVVQVQSGLSGNVGSPITHTYELDEPTIQQTFTATLRVYTGHSNSPFISVTETITVRPAPTAAFSATPLAVSDRTGDTIRTGYLFTDLAGVDRSTFRWVNSSVNTDTYQWTWGDGQQSIVLAEGDAGTPTGTTIDYSYMAEGTYNPSLLAHGPNSMSPTDDTLVKSSYIIISPTPAAPAGLSTKVLGITSVGTNPRLVAGATDNSGGSMPSAGSIVNRITTGDLTTSTVADAYNGAAGTLTHRFNGSVDGTTTLTIGNNVGSYGSLTVSADRDAHLVSASLWPTNFYKVFSAYATKVSGAVPVGFNTTQLTHSMTGNTNVLGVVKDDVTQVPTIDATTVNMVTANAGVLKYISGVPYFGTGGQISLNDLKVYDWIGQTYTNTTSPFTVRHSATIDGTVASVISTQAKTYLQLDGSVTYLSGGIPMKDTGKTSSTPYSLGNVVFNVDSAIATTGTVKLQLSNVNGASAFVEMPKNINVYNTAVVGFDETSIPVSLTLGSNFTDNGKRVFISGANGATPDYDVYTDYFTSSPFVGNITVAGTDEAVVRFGTLEHNQINYSLYLPTGPDLSGRNGTQYFRFAFRRATVANFDLTFSGKISGMTFALPGTQIDATSTMNGWIDGTQVYAGAGVPGENTSAGGNGSNGCAYDVGNKIPTGTAVTNKTCKITFGAANSSDSTGNQILVCVALAPGDYITSISIS